MIQTSPGSKANARPIPATSSGRRTPGPERHAERWAPPVAALAVSLVVLLPYLILGENAFVPIHDNLDSDFVYLVNLVRSGTAFDFSSGAELPNVMKGLPRSALRSGLNVTVVLFSMLPPLWAYAANATLVRAIAFLGMFLLLRQTALPRSGDWPLRTAIACLFALIPLYTLYGLSVAGQPLLIWAYRNILDRDHAWYNWAVVVLFPFFSLLHFIGIFVIPVLAAHALYVSWQRRTVVWRAALVPALLLLLYAGIEWNLLHATFFDEAWTSHRTEFDIRTLPFLETASATFLRGHYHASEYSVLPTLLAVAIATPLLIRRRSFRLLALLVLAAGCIAIWHGGYRFLAEMTSEVLPLLGSVQFDRFYFLLPLIWCLVLGISLSALWRYRSGMLVAIILLGFQGMAVVRANAEVRINALALLGRELPRPSYREFFDPGLFAQVHREIGEAKPDYRVVGLGIHPALLQYNGFYTLDGYQNNYPLSYKHEFRRIIAPELASDPELGYYFDQWGSRAYVFSSDLGRRYVVGKHGSRPVTLNIDTKALAGMGGEYIISSVPIENADLLGLANIGSFENAESFWRIHLYRVGSNQ